MILFYLVPIDEQNKKWQKKNKNTFLLISCYFLLG